MRPFKIEGGCPNEVCVPRRPLSPNPSLDETGRPYDLPDDQEGMRRATRIPPVGQRRGCVSNMTGSCWERTEESGVSNAPAVVGVGAATKGLVHRHNVGFGDARRLRGLHGQGDDVVVTSVQLATTGVGVEAVEVDVRVPRGVAPDVGRCAGGPCIHCGTVKAP